MPEPERAPKVGPLAGRRSHPAAPGGATITVDVDVDIATEDPCRSRN
jgi:hypothetical protein